MHKNVAFIIKHFTERGTELATYNYAKYNESILGNSSIIVAFNKKTNQKKEKFINTSRELFSKKFKIIEIQNIEDMREIIKKEKISFAYIQSHGFYRDDFKLNENIIWGECKTIYHYVFGPMARQGSDIRCVIGKDLNRRFNKKIPVLPYIVNKHIYYGDLRKNLNLSKNTTVIGRHGGFNTFDINFVKDTIKAVLKKRKDIVFLFLNTEKFINHKRVIYLEKTTSFKKKALFIDTCDFMLHARKDGETFGLAVAEFSVANKPVITYGRSKDKEHIRILENKSILYDNKNQLFDILYKAKKETLKNKNFNCYQDFHPEKVMCIFNEICLSNASPKKIDIEEFFRDLPWEIIIIFKLFFETLKSYFFKLIPISLKHHFKKFLYNNLL